jgi:phage-related minor tail protein
MANKLSTELGFNSEQADESIKQTDELLGKLNTTLNQTKTGFKENLAPINASTEAFAKQGKAVDGVSGFLKTARQETRLYTYGIRESTEMIMLLSFALMSTGDSANKSSAEHRKMAQSLMEGVMIFRVADFALKGLGATLGFSTGGVATAITAVLGLAVGLISFLSDSGKAVEELNKSYAKLYELQHENMEISDTEYMHHLAEDISEAAVAADKATKAIKNQKEWYDYLLDSLKGWWSLFKNIGLNWWNAFSYYGKSAVEFIVKDYNYIVGLINKGLALVGIGGGKTIPLASYKFDAAGTKEAVDAQIKLEESTKKYNEEQKRIDDRKEKANKERQKESDDLKKQFSEVLNSPEYKAFKAALDRAENPDKQLGGIFQQRGLTLRDNKGELIKTELLDEKKLAQLHQQDNQRVEQANAAIAKSDKTHLKTTEEVAKEEEEAFRNIASGVRAIQGMMDMLHMKSDSFLGSVLEGLNKVLAVVEAIKEVSAAVKGFEALASGGSSGLLSLLGFDTGEYDTGGYTGSGSRFQPAGIVHRGEVVFEKPIVDKHFSEIMNYRSQLQRSYATGGYVGSMPSISRGGGNESLARAVNALTSKLQPASPNKVHMLMIDASKNRSNRML